MMFAVRGRGWLNRVSRSGSLLLCLGRGTVSRPHCRRVLYCVCSDDLYFMFGVTSLSLDVGHAVFAQTAVPLPAWQCQPVRCAQTAKCAVHRGATASPGRRGRTFAG